MSYFDDRTNHNTKRQVFFWFLPNEVEIIKEMFNGMFPYQEKKPQAKICTHLKTSKTQRCFWLKKNNYYM